MPNYVRTLIHPCVHNLMTERKSAWVRFECQTSPTRRWHCNHYATVPINVGPVKLRLTNYPGRIEFRVMHSIQVRYAEHTFAV